MPQVNACITMVGCWAHVRRKFVDAQVVEKEEASWFLGQIQRLYAIERFCRNKGLGPEERLDVRGHARPILEEIKSRMITLSPGLTPKNALKLAINYTLKQWDELTVYTREGVLEIDNNLVENSIRPIALGRKNYLFAGNHEAAQRSAVVYTIPELSDWLNEHAKQKNSIQELNDFITQLVEKAGKEVVLLIDEVDKNSNNQLFIDFLAMLRNKYLAQDLAKTFHSVVLAGVHDIKSLKLKLRPDAEQKYNSPWNIAAEFTVDMNLQPLEIIPMLEEYARDKQVALDSKAIAERLFYYTSGYPFLVSKLCKIIDEQLLPNKKNVNWTAEDADVAASLVVRETNTNFESLIKNLEHYPDLYNLVYKKLIDLEYQSYSIHDPTVALGLMYGILKNGHGISIHNRIYEEVIYAYMTSKATAQVLMGSYNVPRNFKLDDNQLNMEAILLKFQAFMREQDSTKDRDFLERNGRLVFLAFIKPIINGSGFDFKEPQISEERRLNVVITYLQHKYINGTAGLPFWQTQQQFEKAISNLHH